MSTNYPTSVQTFIAPASTDSMLAGGANPHYTLHDTLADTLEAVQKALLGRRSVFEFGALVGGDLAAAITAALAAGVKRLFIPAGSWTLSATQDIGDMIVEGDGPQTVINATAIVGAAVFTSTGTLTQIEDLSVSPAAGATSITFASAPTLSVGDVFAIYNPTNSSWSGFRTDYKAGEWCEVELIAGSVVTLRNGLYDGYTAANVDVYRMTPKSPGVRDMHIQASASTEVLHFTLCVNPIIERVKVTHANNSCIYLDRCVGARVLNCDTINIGDGGDDYGVSIANSQHVIVHGGRHYSRRHAITTGGNASTCCVPCRDVRVIAATIKNDIGSAIEAADMHGNTEFSSFESCTIYGGANLQGKDNRYINCHITNRSDGVVMAFSEVKGGGFALEGCTLVTSIDPSGTSRGIVEVGGNSVTSVTVNTTLDTTIAITNCKVLGTNLSAITSLLVFVNRGTAANVNLNIDGVTFRVNALGQVLYTGLVSGTADSDFVIVDHINNAPNGTLLHNANGSHYLNFPHRMMAQSGVYQGTTAAAPGVIAGPITFRYAYPRFPTAQIIRSGRNGAASGLLGNFMGVPYVYELTTAVIRPAINTENNAAFTGGATFDLHWSVRLNEI